MLIVRIAEFLPGLVLAGTTLRDVFQTVVVPGPSRARMQVARHVLSAILPLARRLGGLGLPTAFAPTTLVATFVVWMALLILGFGMMGHAMRESFHPPTGSFPQALYIAGSALVTVGLSETDATGPARWLTLAGGFCGLAVMTMAVTYLLEVQTAVARRDAGVLKLTASAGKPPTAIGLLRRYAEVDGRAGLAGALRDARDWCAAAQQSHAAHPSLIYFRSVGAETGWPASLGAVLDAAVVLQIARDVPPAVVAAARLLQDQGAQMAEALAGMIGLAPESAATATAEAQGAWADLRAAGYDLPPDGGVERFVAARAGYIAQVRALAAHRRAPPPRLRPERRA